MKKAFFQLHRTKKNTIIIYILCIISIFVKILSEHFRGTWIYLYLSLFFLIVFYGSIFWSILNGIKMHKEIKSKSKFDFLWILINYIPFIILLIRFAFIW